MTDHCIGGAHIWWLERLYQMQEKHRPATAMPKRIFNDLKALSYVEGDPAACSLTAHGAGMLLTIRQDQTAALKQEKRKRRR